MSGKETRNTIPEERTNPAGTTCPISPSVQAALESTLTDFVKGKRVQNPASLLLLLIFSMQKEQRKKITPKGIRLVNAK